METPFFNLTHFPSVYEPSEDTFLLIDALESELDFIKSLKPSLIAEIGCGSGVNITSIKKALNATVFCFATDVNDQACLATQKTGELNAEIIEVFNMSFLEYFRGNIFDVVLFNPPYVVTESKEITGRGIERSWAGGLNGREVIDRLLPGISKLLSENGVFYLVVIRENNPEEIVEMMRLLQFKGEVIKDRKVRGEHLFVLKFQKI